MKYNAQRPSKRQPGREGRELVILTGLSGSGKSTVLRAFEDMGFYCVDNLPVELIPIFAELHAQGGEDFGRAAQHDPAEPGPVLVPAIGNKCGNRIFDDVPQALQPPRIAFRLLIDRDVERTLADDKAHRDEMRGGPRVGGRQMTDPAGGQKTGLLLGQHRGILSGRKKQRKL